MISGFLQLGTSLSGLGVATPPASGGYAGQPITFDTICEGVQASNYLCTFGPVSGSWGRLNYFAITADPLGLVPLIPPGVLTTPIAPVSGQIVTIPPGAITLNWGTSPMNGSFTPGGWNCPTAVFGVPRVLSEYTLAATGNSQQTAAIVPILANVLINAASTSGAGIMIGVPASQWNGAELSISNYTGSNGVPVNVYLYTGDSYINQAANAPILLQNTQSAILRVSQSGAVIVAATFAGGNGVAPSAVTGLTAGTATSTTQPLTWTAPSTGTAPISYLVQYALTGSGNYATFASGVSGTAITVTGLTASTAYDYLVTPSNLYGVGGAATLTDVSTAAATATISGTAPAGTVGVAYTYTFTTTNFVGAITASVSSGALPAGLALSVSGSSIVLSGTPTTAAAYSFTVHGVGATSGVADSPPQSVTIAAAALYARFGYGTATAGVGGTAAALFASMTQVSGPTTDRNGTMTTTASATLYTWVAVLASAAGSGMRFFDGTGYGGFNGAQSSGIYTGPDSDPTTIDQTYTDGSGNVWNLYRSSGHSITFTYTLS